MLDIPPGSWGATCYTRNGLVADLSKHGWQVHAQGTGHLLAALPEEIGAVDRFVRRALAREAVEEEVTLRHAAWRRLDAGSVASSGAS